VDTAVAHRDVPVRRPGGLAKQDARAVLRRGMTASMGVCL